MEEPIIDIPFFVNANVGQGEEEFFIMPDFDLDSGELNFTIFRNGRELGVLQCQDVNEWEWMTPFFSSTLAAELGQHIYKHYLLKDH